MQCLEPWVLCQALEEAPCANINSPHNSLLPPPPECLFKPTHCSANWEIGLENTAAANKNSWSFQLFQEECAPGKGGTLPCQDPPGELGLLRWCWEFQPCHGAGGAGAPHHCFIAHEGYMSERTSEREENSGYWVLVTENGGFYEFHNPAAQGES